MNVFKFRVLIDAPDDIFRDIEILTSQSLQDFYECILSAFEFNGGVMSSFYLSDDNWEKGKEFTLLDMSEKGNSKNVMSKVILNDIVEEENQKLILVHDFMRMWCFYIELLEEKPGLKNVNYPKIVMKFGDSPDENSKEITDFDAFGSTGAFNDDMNFSDDPDFKSDDDDFDDKDEIDGMFDELSGHNDNERD